MNDPLRFDLHCHTDASFDCRMTLEAVLATAARRGIDVLAITDHNTFDAAREAPAEPVDGVQVIRGIEVGTDRGDVLGLFLEQSITDRRFDHAIAGIHEQGGLAILAHPFKWTQSVLVDTLEKVDGIEIFNARGQGFTRWNNNALAHHLWASRPGLIATAGSDAHTFDEIGRGRIQLTPEEPNGDPRDALVRGNEQKILGVESPPGVETRSQFTKLVKQPGFKQLLRFSRHLGRRCVWAARGAGTEGPESMPPLVREA